MNILFLTNFLPYPLDNGGKIKSYTTIKSLAEEGHKIHLACFNEAEEIDGDDEKEIGLYCAAIKQIPLKLTTSLNKKYMVGIAIKSLFSKYSFGLLKYIANEMKEYLDIISKKEVFDCVYIDHLQLGVYLDIIKNNWPNAKIVLDEHNCEYMIMYRNANKTSNILKKAFLTLETSKLRKIESEVIASVDKVIVLSNDDLEMLSKISVKKIPALIIPIGIQPPVEKIQCRETELEDVNILFVGTLSWTPNSDGLKWYLENVMPIMEKEFGKFKFFIVGKNPGEDLQSLANKYSNVEITGYVDSVLPYYKACDFMVVPLFIGSGQRVKIIEAFSYGLPVISTTVGAEGLQYSDGENIMIANTAEEFVIKSQKMKSSKNRKIISENSRKTFDKFYSVDAVKGLINCAVSS